MNTPQPVTGTRGVQRVRHETRMRMLRVARTELVTPRMLRVTLTGDDLQGFVSAAADDHVKVFFPARPGEAPILPGPPGSHAAGAGPRPIARDYTPRHYDSLRNELDLEFSLHGDGPAAQWASRAAVGQQLAVGGPRGSFLVTGAFDWYLLVGDDTALPAIARRLAELPPGARAIVIAEVDNVAEEQRWQSAATVQQTWLHRDGRPAGDAALLERAVAECSLPSGQGYAWIACESNVARTLRQRLLERGLNKQWIKAAGYWKRGASATHDKFED